LKAELAFEGSLGNQRPEKIIAFLQLVPGCFNTDSVISADLNAVTVLFSDFQRAKKDMRAANFYSKNMRSTTDG